MNLLSDRNRRALWMIVGAIAFGPAIAGDVYRWTDADGRVHYGQRPPHNVPEVRTIQVPATGAPAADANADDAQRRERQRRLLETYTYERERKRAAAAESAQRDQQRAQRCRAIQAQWRRLAFAGPVYFKRADGTRDFLSDERRADEQARLRPAYIKACGEEPG